MNLRLTSWCCANSEREWPARTSRAMRWRCWGLSCSAARAEAGWVSGAAGVVEAETSGTIHMPGTPEGRGQQQPRPMEFRVLSPPPNRGVTAFSCYPAPNHARNANFGRRSLKGAAAKEETVAVFKNSLRDHALQFPSIKWIGMVINLAFGDVECFTQSGEW